MYIFYCIKHNQYIKHTIYKKNINKNKEIRDLNIWIIRAIVKKAMKNNSYNNCPVYF